ncbi:extracellular solute-binding protein family 1 [Methylobacterium sp. 4-46]|uniref:ABC transporter substrate-binding protein n=1 Tax=unclassified Methylobacterium TaxID=2615210 RepID=UPI000152E33F|nr:MULTISPECIES: ABC transporter substrate-binding protein [Methylobacterium]ACA20916.1 extracellular solute-binding protein family 1 [Methylobacterium sp. 4-46]WFT80069.1 ABC transporter substrate-binding protein [Methylobacterium nodulans]
MKRANDRAQARAATSWWRAARLAAALLLGGAAGAAAADLDLFFPVPVDGALARTMTGLVKEFNEAHPGTRVTPVFTGSYDDTLLKTRAAIKAGKPPGAVIMSANFLTDLAIEREIAPFDDLIAAEGGTPDAFMDQFFPALKGNAVVERKVYGVPFHNSTPLLYYNVEQFREAGLDPDAPPRTWDALAAAARKLTRREGGRVTRWGIMMPSNYDYGGWILQALTLSNGGRWYNEEYGGEVYYDTPTVLGALSFWADLVHRAKVHPAGEIKGPAVTAAFLSGQAAMMIISTGSLTFIRDSAKFPFRVAFVPMNVRPAVPIGGASLVQPTGLDPETRKAGWTLIRWLTSPAISGRWSRATGYFAPNRAAYDLPEMRAFLAGNPDAKIAVDQLANAKPWFATYRTVPVRKAIEDELQAVLAGKRQPKEALAAAQTSADAILRPYVEDTALRLPGAE